MSVIETIARLQAARDYIADPKHWITGLRWSPDNKQNCALGAVERAYGHTVLVNDFETIDAIQEGAEVKYLSLAAKELRKDFPFPYPSSMVARVNNSMGHETTIRMFDRAIELATDDLELNDELELVMAIADQTDTESEPELEVLSSTT